MAGSPQCSGRLMPTRSSKSSPPPISPMRASTVRPISAAIRIYAASRSARLRARCPIRRRPSGCGDDAALRPGAGARRAHRKGTRGIPDGYNRRNYSGGKNGYRLHRSRQYGCAYGAAAGRGRPQSHRLRHQTGSDRQSRGAGRDRRPLAEGNCRHGRDRDGLDCRRPI